MINSIYTIYIDPPSTIYLLLDLLTSRTKQHLTPKTLYYYKAITTILGKLLTLTDMASKPTKTERIWDFLELNPEPSSLDIINITQKVGCSERMTWRVLRAFREDQKKITQEFSLLKELVSDILYLQEFYSNRVKGKELMATEKRKYNKIMNRVMSLKDQLDIDQYIQQKRILEVIEE